MIGVTTNQETEEIQPHLQRKSHQEKETINHQITREKTTEKQEARTIETEEEIIQKVKETVKTEILENQVNAQKDKDMTEGDFIWQNQKW